MNISFKASYITHASILKRNNQELYQPYRAKVYKLDPNDNYDRQLLKNIGEKWGEDSYAINIYKSIKDDKDKTPKHIYIITDNKEFYNLPEPENILGVTELTESYEDVNCLSFIQTNPKHLESKEYHHIGSEMIEILKSRHYEKPMYLFADVNAIPFYEKIKFTPIPDTESEFYWEG